jgi:hypothetical protein
MLLQKGVDVHSVLFVKRPGCESLTYPKAGPIRGDLR